MSEVSLREVFADKKFLCYFCSSRPKVKILFVEISIIIIALQ